MNVKILIDQVARYWQYWVKRWKIKIACASRTGCYLVSQYFPSRLSTSFDQASRILFTSFKSIFDPSPVGDWPASLPSA